MKRIIIIALVAFNLISCSKDEDTASVSSTIIDDWSIVKSGSMDNANVIVSESDWSSDCTTKKDYLILNTTNSFTANYFSSACEATFFAQENGTFSFDDANDRLTISGGTDWDGTYNVLTLTNSELVIKRIPSTTGKLPELNFYKLTRRN